jgi:transposase
MNYIGIDLHRRFSQIDVYDDVTDTEITQRLTNDQEAMRKFFQLFPPESRVTVEATGNWYWLVDLLQQLEMNVALANPLQTKVIAHARVKNDRVDARMLNHLRRTDLLPTCWIPTPADRNQRDSLRVRLKLIHYRTQLRNAIRAILAKFNINLTPYDIWRGTGRDALLAITRPQDLNSPEAQRLPPIYRLAINQYLWHADYLSDQIQTWEKTVDQQTVLSDDAKRLMTFPGIGKLSALTILYETGPISRFPDAKRYAAYVGLVPKTKSSADKQHHGHLCKQANMYLKRIFVEIALSASRTSRTDRRLIHFYHRIMKHKGKGIARIALARKITGIVYHMLADKIDYQTAMTKNNMAG